MNHLKKFCVGFFISFIGALPLGYLNVFGFEIYNKNGISSLIYYLFGVLVVEAIVIYVTFIFAKILTANKKLLQIISLFSIFFLLFMAYFFRFQSKSFVQNDQLLLPTSMISTIFTGLVLSSLNVVQIPFWTSWNLYVVANQYVDFQKFSKNSYFIGAIIGSFAGMLSVILSLVWLSTNISWIQDHLLHDFLPLLFIIMALFQIFICLKKLKNNSVS